MVFTGRGPASLTMAVFLWTDRGFGGCIVHKIVCFTHRYLVLKSEAIPRELLVLSLHWNPKAASNTRESKGKQAKPKSFLLPCPLVWASTRTGVLVL